MNSLLNHKKVLIIAYSFPPAGGGRVRRVIKFTKYLREFGWEPIILTVQRPVVPSYDCELINEVPRDIKVVRTGSIEFPGIISYFKATQQTIRDDGLFRTFKIWLFKIVGRLRWWILIPDSRIGWVPFTVIKGWQVVNREQIDAIFASGEPFSSFLSAAFLKFLIKKPLILDFRDEWSEFNKYYFPQKNKLICKINKILELIVVRYADAVISVTQGIIDNFRKRYPSLHEKDKFVCITNGFDPEDFKSIIRDRNDSKFTITYTGSLYLQRSPCYFLEAVKDLLVDMPEIASKLKIVFLGSVDPKIKYLFAESRISDFIWTPGFLRWRATLSYLINSDILLFIEDQIEISNRFLPAKLFEYIGAARPILALANEGGVKDLIEKVGCGIVVPAKDVKAIKSTLKKLYIQYKEHRLTVKINQQEVKGFYRRNVTEQLSKVLNQAVLKNTKMRKQT